MISVLSGRMRIRVGGEERIIGPGEAVLVPANAEHETLAVDGDAEFLSCNDVVV